MAGLFDDLKPGAKPSTGGGLFDDLIPAAPPKRGAIRGVADVGLEVGSGAVRGVKFVADAFGADNPVSSALGTADKFLRDYLSAQAKADDQAISRIMAEAQDKGVWEQVQAGLKAFGVAPVRTAANALGTSLPMIAAAAVPPVATAGAAARVGALATLGGVQGAGIGKSSIYEAVKEEGVKAGMAPDAAERLAVAAQEYNGQNLDSIIAAAGLGAAGMATGVQPILARAFSGAAARSTAVAAGEKVPGMLRSAGVGVLKEAPLEAAQGGQEQLAGNIASQRAGFDVPTMRGVVSSATMEGVAAGPMGAIGGVMDRGHRLRAQESAAADEQLRAADAAFDAIGSAGTVDEAIAAATAATRVPLVVPAAADIERPAAERRASGALGPSAARARNAELMAEIRQLDPAQQQEALNAHATGNNPRAAPAVRRAAQNRLDELLLPIRQPPVGETSELVPEEVDPAGGPGSISMRQRIQEMRARRDVPPVGEATELGLAEAAALSGPLSRETQVRPVPTGQAIELGLEEVEPAPPLTTPEPPARAPRTSRPSEQEAFRQRQQQEADAVVAGVIDGLRKVNTMQARAYVQDFDAGRVTRQDVLDLVKWKPAAPPQPVNAQERLEQASATGALAQQKRDETALLLTADGMPYGTRASAVARASREGGGDVIEVAGGWAVRPQGASDAQQVSGAGVPAPAADGGVRLGADAAGGERAPAGVPVPDPGARQPAFSGQPDVAVADAGGPDAALSGFTDGMSQTRAGAVRMTLRAPAGQPFGRRSRQEVVQEMVADGATVVLGSKGQRILRAGNVAVEEAMLNRTALDYAEHLIARRGESQAQAKPAPAAEREEGRQPEGERDGQEGLQAGQGRREEVTPPAQDAAAVPSGSSAAAAPAPEADGPRVFQKGDRVVIGGTLSTAGRHGEVTDVSVLRMRSMFGGKETVSRHYTVKTDAGAIAHASDDNVQPETGEAPAVVPDVKVGDVWMTPEDAEASAKAARASQRRYEGAKMRARTAASKAEHQKDIDRYKEAADRAEEALEAWRREHGDEEAAAATDAAPPAVDGFTLKKTKHGKTGADLWVVQMDKRVDRDEYDRIAAKAKAAGGKWSKFSKGFEFGTEGGANDFLRGMAPAQAPAAAPAPAPEPSRPQAPAPAPLPAPPAPRERPATTPNRLVSEDAAARARERLRQKLGRLQAGVDPEMLQDGIILAAYHVENGARKFAAYAKAMVADLGDAVRPYLQSWYLALRADPTYSSLRDGMDKAGMVDDLTAEQIDGMLADGEQAAPEPERPPAPAKARERTETPAPPPTVDPFAGNYDALVGKTITRTFTLDDGTTATMQVDAAEALRDIDRRAKAVKDLRACLRGAG